MSVGPFYDALAPWYHVIYEDWERTIGVQGRALSALFEREWPSSGRRVLDAAIGIGTQALGLAALGYQLIGSDLSAASVHRAKQEALRKGYRVGCHVADVRALAVRSEAVDVVIACDNALPHLLSEGDILRALKECLRCLRPGGGCVISMRDYGSPPRSGTVETKEYGRRVWLGHPCRLRQIWRWRGALYDVAFEVVTPDAPERVLAKTPEATYFAITPARTAALMQDAGLRNVRRVDDCLFQPVLVGTK